VSSQQIKGFNGFGIPKSNANVLGGAVGYKFLRDMIFLKAVYLAGKDDPNQGPTSAILPLSKPGRGASPPWLKKPIFSRTAHAHG